MNDAHESSNSNTSGFVASLVAEHKRLTEQHELVRRQLAACQQQEIELASLIDACEKLLRSKGLGFELELQDTCNGEERHLGDSELSSGTRRTNSDERSDRVVSYLQAEYPRALHFREIYEELAKRGLVVVGQDPANALLSCFSSDDRLERVSRGTYRFKSVGDAVAQSGDDS